MTDRIRILSPSESESSPTSNHAGHCQNSMGAILGGLVEITPDPINGVLRFCQIESRRVPEVLPKAQSIRGTITMVEPPSPLVSTPHPAGSIEKVAAMRARVEAGQQCFHPGDNKTILIRINTRAG
jgi:hypothetical protein